MPISKEIELKLAARLEAADAVSQAEAVGTQIAGGIERAFEGVGDRIVAKILNSFKQGFQGFNPGGPDLSGYSYTPSGKLVVRNGTGLVSSNGTDISSSTHGQAPPSSTANPQESTNQQQQQEKIAESLKKAEKANQGVISGSNPLYSNASPLTFVASLLGGRHEAQMREFGVERVYATDDVARRVQLGEWMKKISPEFDTSKLYSQDEVRKSKDDLREAANAFTLEMRQLSKEIKSIRTDLEADPSNQVKQKELAEKEALYKQAEIGMKGTVAQNSLFSSALPGSSKWSLTTNQTLMGLAGIAGTLSALPGNIREYQADMAGVNNLNARSMLSGDFERALAIRELGGEEALKSQARLEAFGGLAAKAFAGAGAGSFLGGLPGMALGGALGLYHGLTNYSSSVRGSVEDQISKHLGVNQEYHQISALGRSYSMGAYGQALDAGAGELSDILIGGSKAPNRVGEVSDAYQPKLSALDKEIADAQYKIGDLRLGDVDKAGQTKKLRNRIERAEAEKYELQMQMSKAVMQGEARDIKNPMNMYDPLQGKVSTMLEYAAARGVGGDKYRSMMGNVIGMGGVFYGQTPDLYSEESKLGMQKIIDARAEGFANVGAVTGSLYQGGMSRAGAMGEAYRLFEYAGQANLDKSMIGQSLQYVAADASRGLGASTGATLGYERALGAAQRMSPTDRIESPLLRSIQEQQQRNQQFGGSMQGAGLVFGLAATSRITSQLKKDLGLRGDLSFTDTLTLQKHAKTADYESMRKLLEPIAGRKLGAMELERATRMYANKDNDAMAMLDGLGEYGSAMKLQMGMEGNSLTEALNSRDATSNLLKGGASRVNDYNASREAQSTRSGKGTGRDETRVSELMEADKVVSGVKILGGNIDALNAALKEAVDRVDTILRENAKSKFPGTTAVALPPNQKK